MRQVLVPLKVDSQLPPAGSAIAHAGGSSMGTSWSVQAVTAPGTGLHALAERMQDELDLVVAQMSHWEPDSNLSRYNSAPAGSWHQLPDPFYTVLDYALAVADASGGAYDPCAGALINCWGFGARNRFDEPAFYAPGAAAVDAIMARGDRGRIRLDPTARRLLQPGGVQLDLSSVAKGYAVDRLAHSLAALGIRHYLVEVGGELRGAGAKPDGQPWWVALEGVPDAGGDTAVLALHGLSVATSGDYRRHFQMGAQRASHTLDPRSGYPIRNDVASVTVIHPDCMAADALSTALTVLGPDAGLALADAQRFAARFLLRRPGALQEVQSAAWKDMLQ
ncbi:MAG: FAD:protein FMN transferase [Pseudomonadota bacterium]